MTAPNSIARRISDLMACLARHPEWRHFADDLGRLWFMVGQVIHENNALRLSNERLTKEVATMHAEASRLTSSIRTATTMAEHWRLEARGGNHDATKEDAP